MQPQGDLFQSPGNKIEYFWERFNFKTDKLKGSYAGYWRD